jgi:hypothetical protein
MARMLSLNDVLSCNCGMPMSYAIRRQTACNWTILML